MPPHVVAVSVSREKGVKKSPVPEIVLRKGWGVIADAHSGPGIRQVSLLAVESVKKVRDKGLEVGPGDFAENITTAGVNLSSLPVGTRLRLGKTILIQVTQIGKECHSPCHIYYSVGQCVMPREGIFAVVLRGGRLHPGDPIRALPPPTDVKPT